jgi:cation transport ATPase
MTNDLQRIADIARLSRNTYGRMTQNIHGTSTVDDRGVALASSAS